jgi:hypothetical protein
VHKDIARRFEECKSRDQLGQRGLLTAFLESPEILPMPAHVTRVALAAPRYGLSFSNPGASEEVLLRNVLQLRFYAILETCGVDGWHYIRS